MVCIHVIFELNFVSLFVVPGTLVDVLWEIAFLKVLDLLLKSYLGLEVTRRIEGVVHIDI